MIIAGIDPGLSGGIALLYARHDGVVQTWAMPTFQLTRNKKMKRELDPYELANILRLEKIGHVFIERVGAMPGQGASSTFAFGKGYGIVLGVISAIGIPMSDVSPRTWKGSFGLTAAKDAARFRASQIFPNSAEQWRLVKEDGRAEAALIALFGMRSLDQTARSAA